MVLTSIEELYGIFSSHTEISIDTRKIIQGSIFFALKGSNFNGNSFAKEALNKGAAYAVIDEKKYDSGNCLLVEDTLQTLQKLATYHKKFIGRFAIAVTGSNGKTTTKELIAAVMKKRFNVLFTEGNLNNHIGVPLTLLKLRKEHDCAVIEMGANHVGEIAALCKMADPVSGIITNIGKAHLEGFGGLEGVIKAKTELYKYIKNNGGKVFVNADDELLMKLSEDIDRITYGTSPDADFVGIKGKNSFPVDGKMIVNGKKVHFKSHLAGDYNFYNILAAASFGFWYSFTGKELKDAIEEYIPSNNRSQIIQKGTNTVWMDCYNANPDSMSAAINNMAALDRKNNVLILGDMFELGYESKNEHEKIIRLIEEKNRWDAVYLVGNEFSKIIPSNGLVFKDVANLKSWLTLHPLKDKTILLKGSRGMKMEEVLECF